jgi:hypothetical protein
MNSVLVDTSVWVDHLCKGEALLRDLLSLGRVVTHPFIIGELACGRLSNRKEILALLTELPSVTPATHEEVLHLVGKHRLDGKGLSWIDAHLLASSLLDRIPLWTRDKRLAASAKALGVPGTP